MTVNLGGRGKPGSISWGSGTAAASATKAAAFTMAFSGWGSRLPLWSLRPETVTVARQKPRHPMAMALLPG